MPATRTARVELTPAPAPALFAGTLHLDHWPYRRPLGVMGAETLLDTARAMLSPFGTLGAISRCENGWVIAYTPHS